MLEVTLYTLPEGRITKETMTDLDYEEYLFFTENNLQVSIEELKEGIFILYSTTGVMDDEGEEIEEMYIVEEGESCQQAMRKLRRLVEEYL